VVGGWWMVGFSFFGSVVLAPKNIQKSKRRFRYEVTRRGICFCGRNCSFCNFDTMFCTAVCKYADMLILSTLLIADLRMWLLMVLMCYYSQ
jgi:hypothetical protein